MKTICLDADVHGIGDAVLTAWISEGSRNSDPRLIHKASGHIRRVLELFGQEIAPDDYVDCVTAFATYRKEEIPDGGKTPRLVMRAKGLGITAKPKRPQISIPEKAAAYADHFLSNFDGKPVALLFPHAKDWSRSWPMIYWLALAWALHREGVAAVMMPGQPDERMCRAPVVLENLEIDQLAALVARASLVIGNDSGPIHLSGTIGIPTLALMGPSWISLTCHMDSVRCIRQERVRCVGCYWKKGVFRPECGYGCYALYQLLPQDVMTEAMAMLENSRLQSQGKPQSQCLVSGEPV